MENSLRQAAKLEQKQQLSAHQRASLEFLQLPRQELDARLSEELAANPLLEEIFPEELPHDAPVGNSAPEKEDDADFEADFADSDEWHSELPLPPEPGDGEVHDIFSGIAAPGPSLAEQLEREFAGAQLPEKIREIAQMIVDSLDEKGYLSTPLAEVAMWCDAELPDVKKALDFVQSLDPAGIGARDLGECFKLQLQRLGKWHGDVKTIIENGLENLETLSPRSLARKYQMSAENFQHALGILRTLDPAPGRSDAHSVVIFPDLEIFPDGNGGFDAKMLREKERRFGVNPTYGKLLEDPSLSTEDRTFIREKLRAAQEVIQSLELRGTTIERLGKWIAAQQREFFLSGIEKLLPLTMKQAGNDLELHETTISRAVSGKYAKTPQGTLPLRFFFTTGVSGATGQNTLSNRAIEEKIRQIIAAEDVTSPLSDDAISTQLKNAGISIARRTVAKYRDRLHIPPASLRVLK